MPEATVLVCSMVEDKVLHFLDKLRGDNEIRLALDEVATFERALGMLAADHSIGVLLLVGREADLQAAVAAVRARRPTIHIVAVAMESGHATLSLRDPGFHDFHLIVRSLLHGLEQQTAPLPAGKLLKISARLPANAPRPPQPALRDPAAVDPAIPALLEKALDWAEAATRGLMRLWEQKEDEQESFLLPSLKALERWLSSWSGIARLSGARHDFNQLLDRLQDDAGQATPLGRVWTLLKPDDIALKLFLVALAGDLDMRFNRSYGVLHDDLGRRLPSLGLACAIVAATTDGATPVSIRAHVAALDWLHALGLIDGVGEELAPLDEPLRVAPPVLDFLVTGQDRRLTAHLAAPVLLPSPDAAARLVPPDRRRIVDDAIAAAGSSAPDHRAILVSGSTPGWLLADCAAIAGAALCVAPVAEPADADLDRTLRNLVAAERLTDRLLIVDLRGGGSAAARFWRLLQPLLDRCAQPPLILTDNPAELVAQARGQSLALASLPPPDAATRRQAIRLALDPRQRNDALVDRLAAHVLADPAMLAQAATLAGMAAAQRSRTDPPGEDDWLEGLRLAAGPNLPDLATRVAPHRRPPERDTQWIDRVILPAAQHDQLGAILRHVRFGRIVFEDWGFADLVDGRGVAALFAGESGTGKTMAAHMLASDLGADLYAIDLAQLVSKYIGETEKNLNVAFDEAERAGAVLLFDEADALFGKRSSVSDAHDRYANIEVAYLLQRLQRFSGLAILTSNFPDNIDAAFTRRLRFRVDFPRPAAADRRAIWDQSIPARLRAPDLDLHRVAHALDLTGGMIRMVAVHAAMLAAEQGCAIGSAQLNAATRGELIRLGNYDALSRLDDLLPPSVPAREAA